jgi:nitroimidazol reductase NimA-like FMN-containing flavoprotein (pyridoxamine 5'-phosphate oxidase superfamily)
MKPESIPAESTLACCPRSRIMRAAHRASYSRADIYALIDKLKTGNVAFVENGEPRCIPITVWRYQDNLYLHVLNGGRLSKQLNSGNLLCISFAETTEWVLSKSAYHHSANYHSAVIYGVAESVTDDNEFDAAFATIINQLEVGRWDKVRAPSVKERKATLLFRIPISEGAYKCRSGGPSEDPDDLDLPVWHGTIPAQGRDG